MKWISLKIYLLPLIMQEVDTVIEKYINLINELRRTNDAETMAEFDELRESISKRIHELEAFYEDNIHDLRITNFEKVRLRLKKLLMYDIETLNKIENTTDFSRGLTFGYNKSDNASNLHSNKIEKNDANLNNTGMNVTRNKPGNNISNSNNVGNNMNQYQQGPSVGNKKNNIPSSNNVTTNTNASAVRNKLSFNNNSNYIGSLDLSVAGMGKSESGSFKDVNKWKEIVFKIKLTEKEYELLLKEKSKMMNI